MTTSNHSIKGVILAGGLGSRLNPLTYCTNKHLLPVYNKPMIYYPIETLKNAGIKDIMIIVSGEFSGRFIHVIKNGKELGLNNVQYAFQEKPNGGIADALALAKDFSDGGNIAVILGDNTTDADISKDIDEFVTRFTDGFPHAHVFLKEVKDPQRFGVADFDDKRIKKIIEKPSVPPSNMAVTGLYLYDRYVFDYIKNCKPSGRGELEITDVNNFYIQNGFLTYSMLNGFWQDAGTIENLYQANKYWAQKNGQS